LAGVWELGLGAFPPLPNLQGWFPVPAYTNTVDYTEYLLYFWASGILLHAKQNAYMTNPQ